MLPRNKTKHRINCSVLVKKKRFLKSQLNQFGTVPGNYDMHNKIDMPRIIADLFQRKEIEQKGNLYLALHSNVGI